VRDLNAILRRYNADLSLGAEVQVQWNLAQKEDKQLRLDKLLLPGVETRSVVGFNKHEDFNRSQYGGTSVSSIGRANQFVQSSGSDPHNLGRWCWIQLAAGSTSTRIVSAYLPCRTPLDRRETVYNQHRRHFTALGDNRCPRTIFVEHLSEQIALWKAAGEQVLLFIDANSDVYDGPLAKRLRQDDIRMSEVCQQILGHKSPKSHHSGNNPITGIFATPGLQ
jgi:hypothetical protein